MKKSILVKAENDSYLYSKVENNLETLSFS